MPTTMNSLDRQILNLLLIASFILMHIYFKYAIVALYYAPIISHYQTMIYTLITVLVNLNRILVVMISLAMTDSIAIIVDS
jgi:hypothetical protein